MDYSLKTNDIEGARPSIKHHSKQLYTLFKKKSIIDDANDSYGKSQSFSHNLGSKYVRQHKDLSKQAIGQNFRKQEIGNLYQETLKSSQFNTRNLMGSWQSAQRQRTGRQFQLPRESQKNPESIKQTISKSNLSGNNKLYNYRKLMDHPPLLPFKDIEKMLDYSLGHTDKVIHKQTSNSHKVSQHRQTKQSAEDKKISQSVILSGSGFSSLQQLKKIDKQALFDKKSPYFPHIYRDYDLSGYENKYSGNRYWNEQPTYHYNIPSIKGVYFKKF